MQVHVVGSLTDPAPQTAVPKGYMSAFNYPLVAPSGLYDQRWALARTFAARYLCMASLFGWMRGLSSGAAWPPHVPLRVEDEDTFAPTTLGAGERTWDDAHRGLLVVMHANAAYRPAVISLCSRAHAELGCDLYTPEPDQSVAETLLEYAAACSQRPITLVVLGGTGRELWRALCPLLDSAPAHPGLQGLVRVYAVAVHFEPVTIEAMRVMRRRIPQYTFIVSRDDPVCRTAQPMLNVDTRHATPEGMLTHMGSITVAVDYILADLLSSA